MNTAVLRTDDIPFQEDKRKSRKDEKLRAEKVSLGYRESLENPENSRKRWFIISSFIVKLLAKVMRSILALCFCSFGLKFKL